MPSIDLAVRLLGDTDLFGGLDVADRTAVAMQMRTNTYAQRAQIFSRDDPGKDVHLVLDGHVRLSIDSADGRVLSFKRAGRGEIFGEIAALDGGVRTAGATALTPVKTLSLTRARLMRLVETRPVVARSAIDLLCEKLRKTSEQVEDIALHTISVRVARFLLLRLGPAPQCDQQRVEIELGMSQADLAELIGASRQKVSEAISALKRQGALGQRKGRYACNVGELQRIAHTD
jgi:CRP-like cAMP-binding protein